MSPMKIKKMMVSKIRRDLSRIVKEVEKKRSLMIGILQRSREKAYIVNSAWLDKLIAENEALKESRPKTLLKLARRAKLAAEIAVEKEITKLRRRVSEEIQRRGKEVST